MENNQYYYRPPVTQSQPYTVKKDKFRLTKKDTVFTFIFLLLTFVIVNFVLVSGLHLGLTVAFILLFLISTAYLFDKRIKVSLFSYVCGALSLAGSVVFALYDDLMMNIFMLFLICALFTIYICGISGTFRHNQGSYKMLFDTAGSVLVSPFAYAGDVKDAYSNSYKSSKGIKNVLVGIAVSIPVLLVVIPLLKSSDAAFDGLLEHLFESIGRYILQIVLSVIIFPFLILFFVNKAKKLEIKNRVKKSSTFKGIIAPSVTVTFLTVISITYLVYLFSQLAYFFSAFSGILPHGYTFSASEYARRGFFEMFAICVINMVIITLCCILTKKNKGKINMPVKLLSLFILLFTSLILITAMAKMKLNIETYALSKNRVMVSVFMLMIFIAIVFYIIHLFAPKVNYMQPVIVLCSALFIVLAYSNVDYQIAKYNVDAYVTGKVDTIDVENISDMSSSAVPILIDLVDSEDHIVSKQAKTAVLETIEEYFDVAFNSNDFTYFPTVRYSENDDFRTYNRANESAKKLLSDYYNSLDDERKENLLVQYSFDAPDRTYCYNAETDQYEKYFDTYDYHYSYNEKEDRYKYSEMIKYNDYE